jgi:uncharacterized protein (TIGR02646 family)
MLNLNRDEPKYFVEFKKKHNPHKYEDNCNNYELRDCLRQALIKEQREQCLYCEKKIKNSSDKVHIDHIKQRGKFHKLECEYSNMALSCNSKNHCGIYKDNQGVWEDSRFINIELQENPSDFFNFVSNGEITPKKLLSEDQKIRAKNTIKYLNLNHKDLVGARKIIGERLYFYKEDGYSIDEIFNYFKEFESIFK